MFIDGKRLDPEHIRRRIALRKDRPEEIFRRAGRKFARIGKDNEREGGKG
jgi:hypothetical protein